MAKFIFVTGGVVSGLGKGITGASLARLIKSRGYKVFMQKFDPYINVDPGTMSPIEHGEVYVTADGAETDLDLGHYERFIDENLSQTSNITSGRVYSEVISKERAGGYLGATVQVVPHVTGVIKNQIYKAAEESGADVIITEIGGTAGDIESLPFIEAIRQFRQENERNDYFYIHATLVPFLRASGEYKSKPTQHSVAQLRSLGIHPHMVVTRSETPIGDELIGKISRFCNVKTENVVEAVDAKHIFHVPLAMQAQKMDETVLNHFGLDLKKSDMTEWNELIKKVDNQGDIIKIALVGKYVALQDAYLSVAEALRAAGWHTARRMEIQWIDSETITDDNVREILGDCAGILVPGGFGTRGIPGKLSAIKYARENKVPYMGICLGMQLATIEFAQNVVGISDATSSEFDAKAENAIIDIIRGTEDIIDMGGTLRLGDQECALKEGTKAREMYGAATCIERHRHRYEFNNKYREQLEAKGMIFSGEHAEKGLVEIIELTDHPFFVAGQFHPEFTSRPTRPNPMFLAFVKAAIKHEKEGN